MNKIQYFIFLILLSASALAARQNKRAALVPENLRCEYLINPRGIDERYPRLSWTLQSTDSTAFGQQQTAYRIVVASREQLLAVKGDIWDSGWVNSNAMQQIVYQGKPLRSDQTYYWKLLVKDEKGFISKSKMAYWTTGLLDAKDWTAKWVGCQELFDPAVKDCNIRDPWFRKKFQLKVKPAKATLFVASVGYHEVYVNGKKISDDVLAPAVTDHTRRARYVAYDIAPQLKSGNNVIGIWLGTSWSIFGPYVTDSRPKTPIVIAQAAIYNSLAQAKPGIIVKTDESWKTHPSPNQLLGTWDFAKMGGELWDANKEMDNWNSLSCEENKWAEATVYHPKLQLSAQMVEPNRLFKTIRPKDIVANPDGSYRVDMGLNFAGWTELKVKGKQGDKIEFIFSERAQNDMTFNMHSAYIIGKKGSGTFKNRFNYSSGRWITIKGLKYKPQADDIRGWMVRTNFSDAASFQCSDTLQNWIYDRVGWTFENLSLGGYVVDCPQRERLGYGGDAHATCETAMFNYKMGAFYTKWMEDWRDVQGTEPIVGNMHDPKWARKSSMSGRIFNNGILPHTAPTYSGGGGPAWGGIVVSLPWYFYQHEGDKRMLEKNFQLIKNWLSFLDLHTKDNLLQRYGGSWDFLGDWLWPNATAEGMNNDKPETLCLNNSYRVYNLLTAIKIAKTIGQTATAENWGKQAEAYRKAIHAKFYNSTDHSYADGSMANLAAALLAGIPPPELRGQVMKRLEDEILVVRKGHIHAGITGGALLFKLLREEGRDDLLYSMTAQKDYPGWGYMKANGATTLWEMWEKDLPGHSLLHSSYLYPGAWYIEGIGGIRRSADGPGFQKFVIRLPLLNADQMNWAKVSFASPAGFISTSWKWEGKVVNLQIAVPPNCIALLQLRKGESMDQSSRSKHIKSVGVRDGFYTFELKSGAHQLKILHEQVL
ncbi:family 78 glycoside hydrolase catalytic domain [Pedobacter heparinus]|uniref:family 78 glycoside hydrolase catalytic domain n=1 Tax=Pedobacter heparinus TaxID=984 RepID=UPI0029314BBE|nr:family 78 glycoside hydrolase catalytic domain [Pedobacter heparinus]